MTENPLPADFAADSAPQGAEPPIIRVSDVSFTYDGEAFALSGASAQIERGEVNPSYTLLSSIAKALKTKLSDLIPS